MFTGKLTKAISLIILMSMVNLLIGCSWFDQNNNQTTSDDNDRLSIMGSSAIKIEADFNAELPMGDVSIDSYVLDSTASEIRFNMTIENNKGQAYNRVLIIGEVENPVYQEGISIQVEDGDGILKWGLDFEYSMEETPQVRFLQYSDDFYSEMAYSRQADTISEYVNINGLEGSFSYTEFELETVKGMMMASENISALKPATEYSENRIQALHNDIVEYRAYVESISSPPLNPDAELYLQLSSNEEFIQWGNDTFGPGDPSVILIFDDICFAFSLCSLVACTFLTPANPICAFCLGGVAACLLYKSVVKVYTWWEESLGL